MEKKELWGVGNTFILSALALVLTFIGVMAGKFEPSMFTWAMGVALPSYTAKSIGHAVSNRNNHSQPPTGANARIRQ
jgi:hypothetical protein